MTSSGAQTINTLTTGDGVSISTDAINVTTTCRYGYNFTISTSVNDNNLYLNGDATNNTTGTYFSPVDGASTLNNSTNAWGYFYNSDSSVVPTKSSIFSPVPVLGQADTLKSASSTASSSDINDSFNLYYGVKTSSTMASGTYKMIPDTNNSNNDGTIVYQATIADNCMRYTVEFNPTSTAGGTTLSGTGTMNNQNIYEGVATPLTSNGFTAPSGYYFAGWNTAQDGTGTTYTDGQSVTDLTAVGSTITLYAQWTDCPGGKICYRANGANVEGTMGMQTVADTDTSIMLLASNFSRSGYGFAGWSDVEDYTTNPNAHFYGPQEDITFTAGQYATKGLKLYAVWIQSAGSLQSDTASVCANLTTAPTDGTANLSSVSALTDERDNSTYAIAKLADGNCWMIENLRLEAEDTRSDANKSLTQGYGTSTTYGNFTGLADAESTGFTGTYTANGLYYSGTQEGTASIDIGTTDYPAYRMPRYNNLNTANRAQNSPNSNTFSNDNTTGGMYSYGNYYTWHAAIADLTYNDTNNNSTTSTSLCPTGWHLPKGGDKSNEANNELWSLVVDGINGGTKPANYDSETRPYYTGTPEGSDASNKLRAYPNNFLYSGYFGSSSAYNRGSYGYYWSSTAFSNNYSYYLSLYSSYVRPGTYGYYKYNGYSIRCVAEKPYMQDMTQAKLAALMPNTGDEVTLYDKRDDQAYTVAKLADGKYWMTENLNIAGGTALSSDDTDFDSNYTLPTTDGWTVSNGKLILPASATKNAADNDLTDSTQFSTDNYAYVFNSGNKENCGASGQDTPCYSYYSWDTATLGSGRSISTDNTDADYSICPKNWRLPTSGSTYNNGWKRGDFYALATSYGVNLESNYYEYSSTFFNNAGPNTTPGFLLAGYYSGGGLFRNGGSSGNYWSSTSDSSSSSACHLHFDSSYVNSAEYNDRYSGFSVRCLFGS